VENLLFKARMKVFLTALLVVLSSTLNGSDAFTPTLPSFYNTLHLSSKSQSLPPLRLSETPCDLPSDVEGINTQSLLQDDATAIRQASVLDINGEFTTLSPSMGNDDSIVIFLRHLG